MTILHFLFGIFGNATALFLYFAPVITFRGIVKCKSTEDFSGVPYISTMLNGLLCAWYGLPFVTSNNLLVTTINSTGAVIESVYVIIFIIYAPRNEKAKMLGLLALALTVFSLVVFISFFTLHGQKRKLLCGIAAMISSVFMYLSPLAIMGVVIRTKSVKFMPFFLSLFGFLCGTSWLVYGLLAHDVFIWVPNGIGCGLGALQLILYTFYRNNNSIVHEQGTLQGYSQEA